MAVAIAQKPEARSQKPEASPALRANVFKLRSRAKRARRSWLSVFSILSPSFVSRRQKPEGSPTLPTEVFSEESSRVKRARYFWLLLSAFWFLF
jgi:hypothetical protein